MFQRREQATSAVVAALCVVACACHRADERSRIPEPAPSSPSAPATAADWRTDNPFTRPLAEPASETCVTITIDSAESPVPVTMSNACDHAVAVLTSPLEMSVRRTGKERSVCRTSSAAYAELHVIEEEALADPFRGDGVTACGGWLVRRPPGYVTVAAKGTVTVPLACELDETRGRRALVLMTYEAPMADAPARGDGLDCAESVERCNRGVESAAPVHLGRDARRIGSRSIVAGTER